MARLHTHTHTHTYTSFTYTHTPYIHTYIHTCLYTDDNFSAHANGMVCHRLHTHTHTHTHTYTSTHTSCCIPHHSTYTALSTIMYVCMMLSNACCVCQNCDSFAFIVHIKSPNYSRTSLIRTPMGQKKVPLLVRCPHCKSDIYLGGRKRCHRVWLEREMTAFYNVRLCGHTHTNTSTHIATSYIHTNKETTKQATRFG